MTQPHWPAGTHGQCIGIQRNDDLVGFHARQGECEDDLAGALLNIHRRLPDGRIGAGPDVADKLALQALGPVQELTGLGPHPSELAIGVHSRSG